ncbi:uncharacterized protein DSM5745_09355 [Aspergillus mulundensis]|uniref:phospholipase D n=1 Tax=Aspergillus mulundensis TaxID=1810919 RepID=A0A3D8R0B6_9EURO|nr:Uncharacterized protein DSM5745_09355 [Aspergillus mulundensis]RDW67489.1 Uncharacterized protein DSM5745_09355 [Aspergillus mulundensis]
MASSSQDPQGTSEPPKNRYRSFAGIREHNNVTFHIAGCAYFWAISEALERARESVWIMGWWVSPEVYLRRPPSRNEGYRLDRMLKAAALRGVKVNVVVYKDIPGAMCLNSQHTEDVLHNLDPNISVLRYPDHNPMRGYPPSHPSNQKHAARGDVGLRKLSDSRLERFFDHEGYPGLAWAHHEKLVIVDQQLAFIGGLDLSFGRWDPVQHPIADSHPCKVHPTVFPGQDYNNARVANYTDLEHWEKNNLDRSVTPRMGWEDISVSLTGPVVVDLCHHFVDRWNFVCKRKYFSSTSRKPLPPPKPFLPDPYADIGTMDCQIVRSATGWSHGILTEYSLCNAYLDIIAKSEHFVYLEQQFFITCAGGEDETVWNKVGEAFVSRILRAAREKKRYKVIVVLPALPAFPGDINAPFKGNIPRALMKLQFNSINRGGSSVFDRLKQAGLNPDDYIRFFNLRSYDRLKPQCLAEDFLNPFGLHVNSEAGAPKAPDVAAGTQPPSEAQCTSDYNWDTVSSCCMLHGPDIRTAPWPYNAALSEVDAFVQEEVYVHSKLLIADDKVVLCGSANLNDRSLKGGRDSEIAVVVEDTHELASTMHGQDFQANWFAAIFRRYLCRKHLGLLPPQDMRIPGDYFIPAPAFSAYDFGSQEDLLVRDPLSDDFLNYWDQVARRNTLAFRKVFNSLPDNGVKDWNDLRSAALKTTPGHVCKANFSTGEQAIHEIKEELSAIKGTLVEMPLEFLANCDIQPEGAAYNMFTRPGLT